LEDEFPFNDGYFSGSFRPCYTWLVYENPKKKPFEKANLQGLQKFGETFAPPIKTTPPFFRNQPGYVVKELLAEHQILWKVAVFWKTRTTY